MEYPRTTASRLVSDSINAFIVESFDPLLKATFAHSVVCFCEFEVGTAKKETNRIESFLSLLIWAAVNRDAKLLLRAVF